MKVLTLRNLKSLPAEYVGAAKFFVRIAGQTTECASLHDAKRATAYVPQMAKVTFSKAEAQE